MVFGWGKKKQEVPIEKPLQEKQILLSDVSKIVIELEELRKSQTTSEIKHLRDNTEPLIEDLIKIGNHLEKDDLKIDDIDKHLAIIVVRGKKQVIDVIKKDVMPLQKISSIQDAEKLNSSLNLILKKVGDVLGRQTRVIHIFAKKYATQLKENLEIMNKNHSEIQDLLKNYDSTKAISTEITDALNQIKTLSSIQQQKSQKIVETKQNLISLNEKILSFKSSIDKIKLSENYKKYLDLKNELDLFGSKKTNIKNDIDSQFTKISRPLGRYQYVSSLDKDQKKLLSILIENPFDVLFPQNKDSIILILENVRKGISSGSISVKDTDKSLSHITETEESLDGFIVQISEYLEKHKELTTTLDSLMPQELISLENELTKTTSFREDSELKCKSFQDEIDEIDSKIPQLKSEIEKKLRHYSNTKYTLLS